MQVAKTSGSISQAKPRNVFQWNVMICMLKWMNRIDSTGVLLDHCRASVVILIQIDHPRDEN